MQNNINDHGVHQYEINCEQTEPNFLNRNAKKHINAGYLHSTAFN